MTYYGRWTYKYEEAARRGAAGVLIVHETAPASYGWATVKNCNTNTMFDIVRANPAPSHAPIEGWIQRDTRGRLCSAPRASTSKPPKAAAQARDFQPVDLKAQASPRSLRRHDRGHHLAQCRRHPARHVRAPTRP